MPEEIQSNTPVTTSAAPKSFDIKKVALTVAVVGIILALLGFGYGYFLNQQTTNSQSSTNTPTIKPATSSATPATSSAKKDETADWKTFNGNGFSFKYPKEWEPQLAPGGNTLLSLGGESMVDATTINYSQENTNNFDAYVKSRVGVSKTSDLTVDGHKAVELSYQNSAVWRITVVINKDGKEGVKFEVYSPKVDSLEKILSTFKFL